MKKSIFFILFLAVFCSSSFAIDIAPLLKGRSDVEWTPQLWDTCSDKCGCTLGGDSCGQGFAYTNCMQNCYDMFKK